MKVHRIITTIEVENDNSITSIELIKLYPANNDIPLAITNITTNGNAKDIEQAYDSISKRRLAITDKLKGIVRIIDNSLDSHDCNVVTDDNSTNETNYDGILSHFVKQDDVGMTNANGADTDIDHGDLLL